MATGSLVDALNDLTKSVCPNRIGKLCGISAVPAQVASYAEVASSLSGAAPTICETGFSCGHSTMTFLESNPRVRVVNFDLPTLAWARRAREYMKTRYGSRVTVVDGSSRKTIANYTREHPELQCDLVVVDGDHTYVSTLIDLVSLLQRAPCNASVLLDDVCDIERCHAHVPSTLASTSHHAGYYVNGSNHPSIIGPTLAWNEALRTGHVTQVKTFFEAAPDRGWVLGRQVCSADGKPLPMHERYSVRPQPVRFHPDVTSPRVASTHEANYKQAEKLWADASMKLVFGGMTSGLITRRRR